MKMMPSRNANRKINQMALQIEDTQEAIRQYSVNCGLSTFNSGEATCSLLLHRHLHLNLNPTTNEETRRGQMHRPAEAKRWRKQSNERREGIERQMRTCRCSRRLCLCCSTSLCRRGGPSSPRRARATWRSLRSSARGTGSDCRSRTCAAHIERNRLHNGLRQERNLLYSSPNTNQFNIINTCNEQNV